MAPRKPLRLLTASKGQAFRFAMVVAVSTGMTDYVHFEEISQFVAGR
ncbi:hypothetical protein KOY48_03110 [Candidatus Minimicrobia naudis]|uniref:Uncharacterized protein n=1 Tax=Candidatus Minimicrobia naudis TaxID=2841263 RepID=A0A8F1MAL8_9BACT|nr:hypothetical protein KOY48_03110 [Candidatus Minimicrobia naudis]